MTNYPSSLDNIITLPGVSGSSQEDIAIEALRDAALAIEAELGINPSGIYSDVRARLDILEARINFGISPSIPNDGYVNSPLLIQNLDASPAVTLTISDGYGEPTEDRVDGSIYLRGGDGYLNNQLYIRLDGAWNPIQTASFIAAGDLSGDYLSQTVIGIQGVSVSNLAPTDGYALIYDEIDGYYLPRPIHPLMTVLLDDGYSYDIPSDFSECVVLVATHVGPVEVNLPVSPATGTIINIKDYEGVAAGGDTIDIKSAEFIDGVDTYQITTDYGVVRLVYTGTTWSVL